jgi:hypothetical protein
MVTGGSNKDLGFVHQTAKGFGMDDAVAIPLKSGAHRAGFLISLPATRQPAPHGTGGKALLPFLKLLTYIIMDHHPF